MLTPARTRPQGTPRNPVDRPRRRPYAAAVQVDTENPTGAFGLYRRLGFAPVRTRVQWACTLQPVP
jgi:hypothetical protein